MHDETPGSFLGTAPWRPPPEPGPVGIVTTDLDLVAAYLDTGPVGPYVVIRTVNDVPERLGGLAILTPEALTPALREALLTATLGA